MAKIFTEEIKLSFIIQLKDERGCVPATDSLIKFTG